MFVNVFYNFMIGVKEAQLVEEDVFAPLDEFDALPIAPAIRTKRRHPQIIKQGINAGIHIIRVFFTAFASQFKQGVVCGPCLGPARQSFLLLCLWHIFLPQS